MTDSGDACCLAPKARKAAESAASEAASSDQVAIITGCASGIGRGTALAFAALNYRLVLVDRQAERLSETGLLCGEKSSKGFKVS